MRANLASRKAAFSLIEMLVAAAVFVLLVLIVAQIVNSTSSVASESRKRLDADSQARTVLDRFAQDFGRMSKRSDLDFLFASEAGNDWMFFLSEVPGYFSGVAAGNQSGFSLVGYRVNDAFALERLGKGLAWSGGGANNEITFITYDPASQANSYQPLASSATADNPAAAPGATDPDFQVISDAVFRVEFCYLLKDGSFSTKPATNPAGVKNNLSASVAPARSDGAGNGYSAGSRWYDTAARRGYLCVDAASGATVWMALGWKDVTAVVVAVAALDAASRKIAPDLQAAAAALPDVTEGDLQAGTPKLMDQAWGGLVHDSSFTLASGLPAKAAAAKPF